MKINNTKFNKVRNLKNFTNFLPDNIEKQRMNFVPEIEPELIPYHEKKWKTYFPYKKNLNYKKLQLSNIGIYSIFYPNYAEEIARILRSYIPKKKATITDATSNMGGAVFAFANYFDKINAVEIVKLHCDILENNLKVYGVKDKVDIHCVDYLDIGNKLSQDIVFFDPPWGGKDYKEVKLFNFNLDSIPIEEIIRMLLPTSIVAMRVPHNYDFKKLFKLTAKSMVYTFYKPNGKLSFFLVILEKM